MLSFASAVRTLALALACTASAAASTIIYDGFSYPAGSGLDTQSGGTGFSNAWFSTSDFSIANGSIAPLNLATTGNHVSFQQATLAGEQADRSTLFSGIGANGTTSWLGFVLRPDNDPTTDIFYLTLAPLQIGKVSATDANVYAVHGLSGKQLTSVPMVQGAAVFVAVKLDFNANPNANDTVSVYFNPTPGLPAPDTTPIVVTDINFVGGISDLFLFAGNHTAFSFDEPRFGDSYADVAPGSPFGWFELGHAKVGSNGTPHLSGTGTLGAGSANQLDLVGAKPSTLCTLVLGSTQLEAPFKGGVLVPNLGSLITLASSASGAVSLPFTMPAGFPSGTTLFFQVWIPDAGATAGYAASNGLEAVTP
jgi:hypothetical protein